MIKRLVLAMAFVGTPALASDWRYISEGGGGTRRSYVDLASIQYGGANGQAWVKSEIFNLNKRRVGSSTSLWKFDCFNGKMFAASSTYYDNNERVIGSNSPIESPYEYKLVVPDSFGETVMNIVCVVK